MEVCLSCFSVKLIGLRLIIFLLLSFSFSFVMSFSCCRCSSFFRSCSFFVLHLFVAHWLFIVHALVVSMCCSCSSYFFVVIFLLLLFSLFCFRSFFFWCVRYHLRRCFSIDRISWSLFFEKINWVKNSGASCACF